MVHRVKGLGQIQVCKQNFGIPFQSHPARDQYQCPPRPHRMLNIAPLHIGERKWLNTKQWCRTRPTIRQWIRVRRKHCRQCSCEILLGWLSSGIFSLSDWVLRVAMFGKSLNSAKIAFKRFCFFTSNWQVFPNQL